MHKAKQRTLSYSIKEAYTIQINGEQRDDTVASGNYYSYRQVSQGSLYGVVSATAVAGWKTYYYYYRGSSKISSNVIVKYLMFYLLFSQTAVLSYSIFD